MPQLMAKSSYFTPPMCLCTMWSGPASSSTTTPSAFPPPPRYNAPAFAPSTSSANRPPV